MIDLFAALNLATGEVISRFERQHRATEFIKFLDQIDEALPAELDVHVVLDNASTHKTPAVRKWLLRHPRFTFHFTPTSSSWLNLVERWFAELTTMKLRRSTHTSVRQLNATIRAWIDKWTTTPSPTSGPIPPTKSWPASPHAAEHLRSPRCRRYRRPGNAAYAFLIARNQIP